MLPLAEPADSHVTQSEQAKCRKCVNSENDAFGNKEGKQVYHCLACSTYLTVQVPDALGGGWMWIRRLLSMLNGGATVSKGSCRLDTLG